MMKARLAVCLSALLTAPAACDSDDTPAGSTDTGIDLSQDAAADVALDATADAPDDETDGGLDTALDTDGAEADAPVPENFPEIDMLESITLPRPTASGLPEIAGFTVNARVHPHGEPAIWVVEFGPDAAYGTTTTPRALPGQLTAHFTEDWASGLSGWNAGFSGLQLTRQATGGPDGGPFLRYTDDQNAGNDVNHFDGIGLIHLGPYFYLGNYYWAEAPPLYLGGGSPDLRGAQVSLYLRGVDWVARGTELGTWIQGYRDHSVVEVVPEDSRYPNYAFTGDLQTDHLASGEWELAQWTLRNLTQDWTFAGAYGGRLLYDYSELDPLLGGVNVDMFIWQILYVDINDQPEGSIDTAELELTYRQHSVCAASNGGSLIAEPAGGTGADRLADGWRWESDHGWLSAEHPTDSQVFEYAFENPITLMSLNVHNAVDFPSENIEVAVSGDAGENWTVLATPTLPETHELGPNYLFYHADAWELVDEIAVWAPLHPTPIDRLRVTVLSGFQDDYWGLGEIEAFGMGALERTDDDWYDVNQDIRVESGEWHYRVSVTTSAGTAVGPDQVVDVP